MTRTQIVKLLVSLALLAVALYLLDWPTLIASFQKVSPIIFILAVLITCIQFVILGLRWYQLIYKLAPRPFLEHLRLYLYGVFLNSFTPANVGGDTYRFLAIKSSQSNVASLIVTLIRERVLGLLAYFVGFLICASGLKIVGPILPNNARPLFFYSSGITLAGTLAILLSPYILARLMRVKAVYSQAGLGVLLTKIYEAVHFSSLTDFVYLMGLSLLGLIIWIATIGMVALDLGLQISWLTLGMIVVLTELIRLLPVSIQGVGVREAIYAYLFTLLGQQAESGFVLGAISYLALSVSLFVSGLIGWGLLYWPAKNKSSRLNGKGAEG
ncbi:MAG: lysylphosphatidylglycerol synthase transmembrane domain-containing protein [Chloroflexota bacterium]